MLGKLEMEYVKKKKYGISCRLYTSKKCISKQLLIRTIFGIARLSDQIPTLYYVDTYRYTYT